MAYDFSFVIPAYNEQANIGALLDAILLLGKTEEWKNYEIVVTNDNSSDKTPSIVESFQEKNPFIKLVNRTKGNNGMGFALVEGTRNASGKIIIWTMGDLSDDLETYPKLINAVQNHGFDMVFCSRYMSGGSSGDLARFKAFLSSSFTILARVLFRIPVHDITNAFRAFKKEVFDSVNLESGDFAISPEFAIKAHKEGFKLGEVPTNYTDRQAGTTKFKMLKMGRRYSWTILKLFFSR
tara:strand:+ start:529 stop:1242 length:714 start_codon:yes stop_codon:yes gene_type:complete